MKTPYELLAVATSASDADIKQAYLQKVKENPPDRDPERFQAIRAAYEAIKDSKSRLSQTLFNKPETDFASLLDQALQIGGPVSFKPQQLHTLLSLAIDDETLLTALPHSGKS